MVTSEEGNPLPVGTYYYTINQNDGSDLQTGNCYYCKINLN